MYGDCMRVSAVPVLILVVALSNLAAARCDVVFHKNANLLAAINVGRLACGLIVGYEPDHGDEQRERKEPKRTNMHFVFRLR